jgi:hypothetical protein
MNEINWDDDANIERWCDEQHEVAAAYLRAQPVKFGQLGGWPAWHVAPYVSVWAVESVKAPGKVGWWVICGDLPTDYASGNGTPDPRSAVAVFAKRWQQLAADMQRGETPVSISVGAPENAAELGPLLKSRSELLSEWVRDDSMWQE